MPDVEECLRAALRYNADRVDPEFDQLREPHRGRVVPALAGVVAMMAVVGLVVGGVHRYGRHQAGSGGPVTSFEGHRWLLTSVEHGGTTVQVPASWHLQIAFTGPTTCAPLRGRCPGQFAYNGTPLTGSGTFAATAGGYRAHNNDIDVGFTGLSGTALRILSESGMRAVTVGDVSARIVDSHLVLARAGYTLSFEPIGGCRSCRASRPSSLPDRQATSAPTDAPRPDGWS